MSVRNVRVTAEELAAMRAVLERVAAQAEGADLIRPTAVATLHGPDLALGLANGWQIMIGPWCDVAIEVEDGGEREDGA